MTDPNAQGRVKAAARYRMVTNNRAPGNQRAMRPAAKKVMSCG